MKPREKKLISHYKKMNEADQHALEKFAQFLSSNAEIIAEPLATPKIVEAKEDETVVGALKRLSASYFMLDKSIMLNKTSALMAQHVLQGRDKLEVISELETVFLEQYQELKNQSELS